MVPRVALHDKQVKYHSNTQYGSIVSSPMLLLLVSLSQLVPKPLDLVQNFLLDLDVSDPRDSQDQRLVFVEFLLPKLHDDVETI